MASVSSPAEFLVLMQEAYEGGRPAKTDRNRIQLIEQRDLAIRAEATKATLEWAARHCTDQSDRDFLGSAAAHVQAQRALAKRTESDDV